MKNKAIKKGFTLIELITVVVIIAILAALALPQYARVMEKARSAEARESIGHIRKAALTYYQALGSTAVANYQAQASAATGIPNIDGSITGACSGAGAANYFFHYSITGTIPTTTTINARRCESGGKGPNAPATTGYFVQLVTDLGGQGPDSWTQHIIYQ